MKLEFENQLHRGKAYGGDFTIQVDENQAPSSQGQATAGFMVTPGPADVGAGLWLERIS